MGLGFELNKLSSKPNGLGLDNLGLGLVFGVVWITFYQYFDIWWLNIMIIPFLLFGCYGTILGLINIFTNLFTGSNESLKLKLTIKLPVVIAQLAGFILTVI